jgi:hypothetical protein
MPRIIVTTATGAQPREGAVLLDELVQSVHLSTGHAAAQLVERLAWAISDAEADEHASTEAAGAERPVAERVSPEHQRRSPRRVSHHGSEGRAVAA